MLALFHTPRIHHHAPIRIPSRGASMLPSTVPALIPSFRWSIFRLLHKTHQRPSPLTLTLPSQLASIVHINWHSVWNSKFKYCECLPNAPRIFIGEHYTLVADILITRFTNHKKGYHPIHLFCDLAMSPYWYYFGLVIDDRSFGLAEWWGRGA
jgi:hypothetical protein